MQASKLAGLKEVPVFIKSVHGLDNRPDENLVVSDVLIDKLKSIGFELVNKKNMPYINQKLSSKLLPYERKISNLYLAYVFEKK